MRHKTASLITAASIMLSAVLLITGCDQPQGSKTTAAKAASTDLQGVWKLSTTEPNEYWMHIYFAGSTLYAAVEDPNAPGTFEKNHDIVYNSDGTISVEDKVLTPVKNGDHIDLQSGGKTFLILTKDPNVSGETIKNAPEPQNQPPAPGPVPTPGPSPTPSPSPNTKASAADLQGVWKVTLTESGRYMVHIYFDGSTFYTAMELPNKPGTFVKSPSPFTYHKATGTVTATGQSLTPINKGKHIELQLGGTSYMTMIKDPKVSGETIKKAAGVSPTP